MSSRLLFNSSILFASPSTSFLIFFSKRTRLYEDTAPPTPGIAEAPTSTRNSPTKLDVNSFTTSAPAYKRVRFEKNIKKLVEGLANRIEELKSSLEDKSETQQHKINTLFTYVLDYVIDEKQELKIDIMVNGFINISHHEDISEDFVLTYYDVLRDLRLIDISVLRFYSKLKNYDQEGQITIIAIIVICPS